MGSHIGLHLTKLTPNQLNQYLHKVEGTIYPQRGVNEVSKAAGIIPFQFKKLPDQRSEQGKAFLNVKKGKIQAFASKGVALKIDLIRCTSFHECEDLNKKSKHGNPFLDAKKLPLGHFLRTLQGAHTLPIGSEISAVHYGDFNQDGKTDVLVALSGGAGLLFLQTKNSITKSKKATDDPYSDIAFLRELNSRNKISPPSPGPNDPPDL